MQVGFNQYGRAKVSSQNFWVRGYFVSIVGRGRETVKQNIKKREEADRKVDQLKIFWPPFGGSWFYDCFELFTINPPGLPEVTYFRLGRYNENFTYCRR